MPGFARGNAGGIVAAASFFFAVPLTAAPQPTAAAILDRYVAVTGGASAWHAKHSERDEIEGRTLDGERIVLRATVSLSRSGDSFSDIRVPQVASEGVYKGVAWAVSQFSGVRIKRGMEHDEALRDARMLEEGDWRSLYPKSRIAGIENIGEERCYKVLLLPSPVEKVEWFSIATGLLVRRASSEIDTAGDTPAGYTVEEWAVHDGVRQPRVMLAWRGEFQYRVTVLDTTYNFAHSRADLQWPPEVAEYLDAARAGTALPNAEELVERHIFETGGPEAYERLRTQKITGTVMYISRNIEAHMETWAATADAITSRRIFPAWANRKKAATA